MDTYRKGRKENPHCSQWLHIPPSFNFLTELLLKCGKTNWLVLQSLFFSQVPYETCSKKQNLLHLGWGKEKEQKQRPSDSALRNDN
jgi:hypothetical protein